MDYYEDRHTYGLSSNYEGCRFSPKNGDIWFAGIGLHRRKNNDTDVVI